MDKAENKGINDKLIPQNLKQWTQSVHYQSIFLSLDSSCFYEFQSLWNHHTSIYHTIYAACIHCLLHFWLDVKLHFVALYL